MTYCPDTDGVRTTVDELADNADPGRISPADAAAAQLVYGTKDYGTFSGGPLHASAGFRLNDRWLVASGSTLTPRWRYDGLVDSAFGSPSWGIPGTGLGGGLEIDVATSLPADGTTMTWVRFIDFRNRQRYAFESVERSDSRHAAIVLSMM